MNPKVTEEELAELTREIRKINGVAPMIYTQSLGALWVACEPVRFDVSSVVQERVLDILDTFRLNF